MQTKTPGFRLALSAACAWLVLAGLWSALTVVNGLRTADTATWYVGDENVERCHDNKAVFSGERVSFRQPTQQEFEQCFDAARDAHLRSVEHANADLIKHNLLFFLYFAAVPALLLLGVAGFWARIRDRAARGWRAYWRWIRHGNENARTPTNDG